MGINQWKMNKKYKPRIRKDRGYYSQSDMSR